MHADWLVPDWPAPPGVRAVFTTRHGGVSPAPFDSLNLGDHVFDAPAHVAANRARLQGAIGAQPVFLKQVHGTAVTALRRGMPDGLAFDACFTRGSALACTIMVADCLPVLLATTDGQAVAAAHAGWRGLVGEGVPAPGLDEGPGIRWGRQNSQQKASNGVLEAVYQSFMPVVTVNSAKYATNIIAWLGPCIGPTAFEVGADVKALLAASQGDAPECFRPAPGGKFWVDLAGLARRRLQALGVHAIYGNDSTPDWCTASQPLRFYSHRRDAGLVSQGGNGVGSAVRSTGRMAACIWRQADSDGVGRA